MLSLIHIYGKVYGDLLSAEEKKKLVLQKKKAKKTKKVRQSAQQTIPYVEDAPAENLWKAMDRREHPLSLIHIFMAFLAAMKDG